MTALRIKVTGDTALAGALGRLAADLGDLPSFEDVAQVGAEAVRRAAPKGSTLALSQSVTGTAERNRALITVAAGHAPYVRFGTTRMPARDFTGGAADPVMTTTALQRLESDINQAIRDRGLNR